MTVIAVLAAPVCTQLKLPVPSVDSTCPEEPPPILTFPFDPKLTTSPVNWAFPETSSPVNVPTLVILGCAAVVNVPETKFALTKLPPATLPADKLPVTASDVSVPTDVTFG